MDSKDIELLKKELDFLKKQFLFRINQLQNKIDSLEGKTDSSLSEIYYKKLNFDSETVKNQEIINKTDIENINTSNLETIKESSLDDNGIIFSENIDNSDLDEKLENSSPSDSKNLNIEDKDKKSPSKNSENSEIISKKQNEDNSKNIQENSITHKATETLKEIAKTSFLDSIPAPLSHAIESISAVWKKYKEEQKLPILLLTLSGISIFLIGFGFLLQYSFQNIFTTTMKGAFGFFVASISIFAGVFIHKKKNEYSEFASALLSMGIIIADITLFFLGVYYKAMPPLVVWLTLFLISIGSIYLAFKYETKVVAVLSLSGAIFAPTLLTVNTILVEYSIFLWLITAGILFISDIKKWDWLLFFTFLSVSTTIVSLEFQNIFVAHLFFYLFTYFVYFRKAVIKTTLTKKEILVLVGSLSIFAMSINIGYVLALNGVLFLFFAFYKKLTNIIKSSLLVTVSALLTYSFFLIFGFQTLPIFVAIEGILLFTFGKIFLINFIKNKGITLFFIGLALLALRVFYIFENYNELIVLSCGIILLFIFKTVIYKFKKI
ncbi:DUF2339 domain-containing protein, partial [bacterium]|nr:DUF2339 domain-containing protein [bacterium]